MGGNWCKQEAHRLQCFGVGYPAPGSGAISTAMLLPRLEAVVHDSAGSALSESECGVEYQRGELFRISESEIQIELQATSVRTLNTFPACSNLN